MDTLLTAIGQAAYNGICLACENGDITDFTAGHVSPPEEFTDGITRILIQLPNGKVTILGLFSNEGGR